MKLDFNCDLGENEPAAQTRAFMRLITSANVACGGHAGNLKTIETCVRLIRQHHVRLGGHPGTWGRADGGRAQVLISADDLALLLIQQVGALEKIAWAAAVPLHHIKLHGALYHATEMDEELALSYVRTVARWWPKVVIYARAGGRVVRAAQAAGVDVWAEAYVDRAYRDDGSLVPRDDSKALLTSIEVVSQRVEGLVCRGEVVSCGNKTLLLSPRTICIHADTPGALKLAHRVAQLLLRRGENTAS